MFLLNGPRDEAPREVYLESNRAGRTLAHVPRLRAGWMKAAVVTLFIGAEAKVGGPTLAMPAG